MVVHAIGVGHPRFIFLCTKIAQVLNCSYGLIYQVDRGGGTGQYHNSERPEVLQEKHTNQVWGPQAIVADNRT